MIELRRYNAADFIEVESHTSSKGNIKKYTNGEQWIKVDGFGYESLAEVLELGLQSTGISLQLGTTYQIEAQPTHRFE